MSGAAHMHPLDLTHAPLLDELLDLDFGWSGQLEDLHSDYTCRAFVHDGDGLAFLLRRADGAEISLIFESAVLLESAGRFALGTTLLSFYRGRYFADADPSRTLVEQQGPRYFYYLDFIEADFSVTLAAARVTAEFTPAPV